MIILFDDEVIDLLTVTELDSVEKEVKPLENEPDAIELLFMEAKDMDSLEAIELLLLKFELVG